MGTINKNMTTELAKLQQVIDGCAVYPKTTQLHLDGQTLSPAQLVALFQAAVAAISAVAPLRANLTSAVQAQKAARQAANAMYKALRMSVVAQFGKGSPQVLAFGFASAIPKPRTAASKALAAAKAQATRQVRGPTGKVARQKVTVAGAAGLQLVMPNGQTVPGAVPGPMAPAGQPQTTPTAPTVGSSK